MRSDEPTFQPRLLGVPRDSGAELSYRNTARVWRLIWTLETRDQPLELDFVPDLLAHVLFDLHGTIETEPFVIRTQLSPVRAPFPPNSLLIGIGFFRWDCADWFHMEDNDPGSRGWLRKEQTWADLVYVFLLSRLQASPVGSHHADHYLNWFDEEMDRLDNERAGLFRHLGEPTEMASSAGYSLRQLRRLQRQHAGFGPKDLQRITRFQRQLAHLQDHGELDPLDYADQAHAIREFREFAAMTPGHYLKHYQHGRNLQSRPTP